MFDIDHLKRINDRFGHSVGDAVLKRFAQAALTQLRTVDYFGRYGGDEFLLILTNTNREQAQRTVERIRAKVAGLALEDVAPGMPLTVSTGIAQFSREESVAHIVTRADLALYDAKHAGRDRIASAAASNDERPAILPAR